VKFGNPVRSTCDAIRSIEESAIEVAFLEMRNGDSSRGLEGAKVFFPGIKQAQAKTGKHGPSRERYSGDGYSGDRILRH